MLNWILRKWLKLNSGFFSEVKFLPGCGLLSASLPPLIVTCIPATVVDKVFSPVNISSIFFDIYSDDVKNRNVLLNEPHKIEKRS